MPHCRLLFLFLCFISLLLADSNCPHEDSALVNVKISILFFIFALFLFFLNFFGFDFFFFFDFLTYIVYVFIEDSEKVVDKVNRIVYWLFFLLNQDCSYSYSCFIYFLCFLVFWFFFLVVQIFTFLSFFVVVVPKFW